MEGLIGVVTGSVLHSKNVTLVKDWSLEGTRLHREAGEQMMAEVQVGDGSIWTGGKSQIQNVFQSQF